MEPCDYSETVRLYGSLFLEYRCCHYYIDHIYLYIGYCGKKIGKSIADPVDACAKRMKLLASGDLHTEVKIDDTLEESRLLTTATGELTRGLNILIGDVDFVLHELAKGDFTVESGHKEAYVGDFASLVVSVDELKSKLSGTLRTIQESANQVMGRLESDGSQCAGTCRRGCGSDGSNR